MEEPEDTSTHPRPKKETPKPGNTSTAPKPPSPVNIRGYIYDANAKPLGKGSYGIVYRGLDTNMTPHKAIAIKKVSLYGEDAKTIEHGVSSELLREFSFLQTFRQTSHARSSGILFPTDMFIHEGFVIMIYPLLEDSLCDYLARTTSLSRRENIGLFENIVSELIRALYFCSHYNIRHNDVHASNVLVTIPSVPNGNDSVPSSSSNSSSVDIKLTDLGLCTFEPALPWLQWSNEYQWAYYQAPELGKAFLRERIHESFVIDSRVDVWGLGVIIIEYGAPQSIKDRVEAHVHPQYKNNPSAHKTNRNDPTTVRLSMQGSSEYYHLVLQEWKQYMAKELANHPEDGAERRFYTRLFMLLKNIFTSFEMRWNIRTCHEYWIEHKTKLVIHDYSIHDRVWLSKFSHVLTRFLKQPFLLTFTETTQSGLRGTNEVPIWFDLIDGWFEHSKNIIYTLECFRLLYDYLLVRTHPKNAQPRAPFTSPSNCLVYHQSKSGAWVLSATLSTLEWEALNTAIFGLVYKLLHNVPRPNFKTNVTAERAFLDMIGFNVWSSWIQSPVQSHPRIALSFDSRHEEHDLQLIQNVCNKIPSMVYRH